MNAVSFFMRAAAVAAFAGPAAMAQGAGLEAGAALPGSQLAPAALLKGPLHKVAEPVKVEGHLGRFEIESRFGRFSVRGENMLATRVQELPAIEELQKVQKDAAFQDALAQSAKGIAKFAQATVDDPGKTVENIGAGVSTVMGRIGYMAKSGTAYVEDKASDMTSSGAQPKPRAAPGGEPEPPSFIGDPLGYNKARRDWAKKLNIDPYTTNPVLRPLLDDAAAATFAGNFAVDLTLGAVIAPIQYAYSFDQTVRDSVWNKPAIDLRKENEAKLLALGVQDRTVRDFLRNKWFTPTLQTALVVRLEALGKLPGVESVVATAALTHGETRARFLLESLALLAAHHQRERIARLKMSNLVPLGTSANGDVIAAAAIDYGTWDKDAAAFAQRKELAGKSRTLLVAGKLSARAQQELEKAGWKVKSGLRG
ncbi:MAG TPA: hypothetical protein VFP70_02745 [Burkholderiales bacterium]|nr:hypothetical protein [Burkholderiales bacterium]